MTIKYIQKTSHSKSNSKVDIWTLLVLVVLFSLIMLTSLFRQEIFVILITVFFIISTFVIVTIININKLSPFTIISKSLAGQLYNENLKYFLVSIVISGQLCGLIFLGNFFDRNNAIEGIFADIKLYLILILFLLVFLYFVFKHASPSSIFEDGQDSSENMNVVKLDSVEIIISEEKAKNLSETENNNIGHSLKK